MDNKNKLKQFPPFLDEGCKAVLDVDRNTYTNFSVTLLKTKPGCMETYSKSMYCQILYYIYFRVIKIKKQLKSEILTNLRDYNLVFLVKIREQNMDAGETI